MEISLESIIRLLESKNMSFSVNGKDITVKKIAAIAPDVEEALCYYVGDDPTMLSGIKNSIIFCKPGIRADSSKNNTIITTEHPQLCFYHSSILFANKSKPVIHSQTVIDPAAEIGKQASIGAFCEIEACTIGDNVRIDSGVKIHKGTVLGNNVRIEASSVIGASGVMWAWDREGNKVPCQQTGYVIIEDDVFIGANISIVRGSFENKPTIIGTGTMMAHGTMIGHGSVIGANNHFANNVSIAGSVTTGENCFFGSGSIVRPHIVLSKDTIVGAGAVVVKDFLQGGQILIGNPARVMEKKGDTASGVPAPFST
jgi:UDP-3-O-[3-hydroxymyristoyl] glucosamine N-acyltransferase